MSHFSLVAEQRSVHDGRVSIENANEHRKSLIALACLRVLTLSSKTSGSHKMGQKADVTVLMQKNTDYELYINKLKQEYSKNEKLQQAKMETLREEVARLRDQLKTRETREGARNGLQTSAPVHSYGAGPSSVGFRSMKAPMGSRATGTASSTGVATNRKLFTGDKWTDDILTPVRPKAASKSRAGEKREYVNYNTLKRNLEKASKNSSKSEPSQASPVATPTRKSFVDNFERSSESRSPSPDFTPSRLKSDEVPLPKSLATEKPSASSFDNSGHNSVSLSAVESSSRLTVSANTSKLLTDDETFQSANASLRSVGSVDAPRIKNRKKKKLKLWKTEASKLALEKKDTLHLDNDDLNSLNYYQDANFTNKSPENVSQKRKREEIQDDSLAAPRKKQRNVFTID